jgi:hypothetical protein
MEAEKFLQFTLGRMGQDALLDRVRGQPAPRKLDMKITGDRRDQLALLLVHLVRVLRSLADYLESEVKRIMP